MQITVFTPTYNRGYIITNLYNSLLRQSFKDFEWLVVDDGSTDNSQDILQSFITANKINISYIKTENKGKHVAINLGVQQAKGKLFFIVDSDDYLADNALERILFHYQGIENHKSFAGVCGLRAYFNGKRIGGEVDFDILDCSSMDFRFKFNIKGDMAEVFLTDILKQYQFPIIEGEQYCFENIVWNRIALKYKLRYFAEKIYYCEYLSDGITKNNDKVRSDNPFYYMLSKSETIKLPIPIKYKVKECMDYWRFVLIYKHKLLNKNLPLWAYFLLPIDLIRYRLNLLK